MDIVKLCLDMGAGKAEEIPVSKLVFAPELRKLCENNVCGCFGRNYTCPPFIGDVDELIIKLKTFDRSVIWQNIYPLEDSFDFEGMMDAQKKHDKQTLTIKKKIETWLNRQEFLVLAAGGCSFCEKCAAVTKEPCRFPDEAIASLEAYGINVSKIEAVSSLKYINGANTVTFFSGVFYNA